ncbi:ExeM/NucH family extracellular endonuclease [Vibrio splendidus]|uniref:ExeM/NucH family extracellular endonuclease n=1 Tax=Vibrio splendidus TaxID=29497 RepID=UPI000C818648|nr:ExeM/NucH family extracellular endonuclease [Vibrio splendidus]PMP44498.1 nuclease [Vibrio splendidus]
MERKLTHTAIALAVSSVFAASASAEIIISQYVEGGSYNKAIEIANTGDSAVSLDGFSLAKSSNGGGIWDTKIDLTGKTLNAKSVWVLANSRASDAIKALANQQDGAVANFNGDDPIALLNAQGEVHDMFGVMGDVDFAKDKTFIRKDEAMTSNASYDKAQWNELVKDDITGLGSLGYDAPEPPPAFTCTDDSADPTFTSIQAIQGDGDRSPLIPDGKFESEQDIFVTGVVSAVTKSITKGFYLQALEDDYNAKTSEGLFVETGSSDTGLSPGDVVCVKGKAHELFNRTQLKSDANSFVKQSSQAAPTAVEFVVADSETLHQALERYEGMNVELSADSKLFVTRNFSYDYAGRRNNMVLAHEKPLMKPTQVFAAESAQATDLAKKNAVSQVYLESDYKAASGEIPYYPDFAKDTDQDGSSENHIRLGSRVEGLQGVVDYSYGQYRLIATNTATKDTFVTKAVDAQGNTIFDVTRKAAPELTNADIRIASFNVLNYFNSHSSIGGPLNASCSDQADADASRGCNRGAKVNDEFLLQKAKIIKALAAMDSDIIGLMEVENNGFGDGSALKDLTDGLNATIDDVKKHYSYVEIKKADMTKGEFFGSDAIMVAMLYRADKVVPKGKAKVIVTPEQHVPADVLTRTKEDGTQESNTALSKYQRHSLLQTFTAKGSTVPLSVVVNHLKSKGSHCIEQWQSFEEKSDPANLQGKCNRFRTSATKVLGDSLKSVKGDVLIIGDLNAYGMEDPVLTLTDYSEAKYDREIRTASFTTLGKDDAGENKPYEAAGSVVTKGFGYINLNTKFHGADTFSYTYGGEQGNLDHALANPSLANKVTSITDWHINASESTMFEYSSKYTGKMPKYADVFSASDHDPVIIALDYAKSNKIKLPAKGEKLKVEYYLPEEAVVGDVVTVRLAKKSQAALKAMAASDDLTASTTLTQPDVDAGVVQVSFDKEPEKASYVMTQELADSAGTVKSTVSADVTISEAATENVESSSKSGASFGLSGLFALFGFGFLRRRTHK